jgi:uncharacterized phage protein (TIGR02220 family)
MRARNIKPGFFKNEYLLSLEPLTRLLFCGLWCLADREGRLEDRPGRIKIEILPGDNCNIDQMLNDLQRERFILRYSAGNERFIQIIKFKKHQNPHIREPESSIPAPDEHSISTVLDTALTGTGPAESPFSDSLIPDSPSPEVGAYAPCCADEQTQPSNGSKESIPYREITEYLNAKTGKNFRWKSKETRQHIKARWEDGYKIEDFQKVIDTKVAKWGKDPKYCDYLRPITLFGTKFEAYLNESRSPPADDLLFTKQGQRNMRVAQAYIERMGPTCKIE